jgi:hypothetical protein
VNRAAGVSFAREWLNGAGKVGRSRLKLEMKGVQLEGH